MYCWKCGGQIEEQDRFCAVCGSFVEDLSSVKVLEEPSVQNFFTQGQGNDYSRDARLLKPMTLQEVLPPQSSVPPELFASYGRPLEVAFDSKWIWTLLWIFLGLDAVSTVLFLIML